MSRLEWVIHHAVHGLQFDAIRTGKKLMKQNNGFWDFCQALVFLVGKEKTLSTAPMLKESGCG